MYVRGGQHFDPVFEEGQEPRWYLDLVAIALQLVRRGSDWNHMIQLLNENFRRQWM